MMAGRAKKSVYEAGLVPDMRGYHAERPAVHSQASNFRRGNIIRIELGKVETLMDRPMDAAVILYLCPDVEARSGKPIDWIEARFASIRRGKGCIQSTFAALMPIVWRFPREGWNMALPEPPFRGYSFPVLHRGKWFISRYDGAYIPFPPSDIPRPAKREDAA